MGGYVRMVARRWSLVVLMTVLCTAGAAGWSLLATPSYSAQVRLFFAVGGGSTSPGELAVASQFSQQRVASYAELVNSPEVLAAVIEQVELPDTVRELADRIDATVSPNTVNLVVKVTDTDARRAAATANAFAPVFGRYIAEVERPAEGQGDSPVRVSVTEEATVPPGPDSPILLLNLALGLLVGLGLGLVAAVLRDQSDTAITGPGDIAAVTGASPLGIVPVDKRTARQPLVDPSEQVGRAEAFRTLRTNLQFASVDNPPGTIVVTSPAEGEGKSTCVANIALTLALNGAKVVLVEADLRAPALSGYLGLSDAAGLTNVLAGQYSLREVLVRYGTDDLAVLTCGPVPPNPSEMLGSAQMEKLLKQLGDYFDYVLIDAPPVLRVTDAAAVATVADGVLVVVRHGRTRREDLERALQALQQVNARLVGTVLNFVPARRVRAGGYGPDAASSRPASSFVPQGNLPESLPLPDVQLGTPPATPAPGLAALEALPDDPP